MIYVHDTLNSVVSKSQLILLTMGNLATQCESDFEENVCLLYVQRFILATKKLIPLLLLLSVTLLVGPLKQIRNSQDFGNIISKLLVSVNES